jgi:hypothetical protein
LANRGAILCQVRWVWGWPCSNRSGGPLLTDKDKTVRVIAGSILGASSPVKTSSPIAALGTLLRGGSAH